MPSSFFGLGNVISQSRKHHVELDRVCHRLVLERALHLVLEDQPLAPVAGRIVELEPAQFDRVVEAGGRADRGRGIVVGNIAKRVHLLQTRPNELRAAAESAAMRHGGIGTSRDQVPHNWDQLAATPSLTR